VIIYNLSSVESPDTIDTIGRLFLNEKDKELKIELVSSLLDIDGQPDKKLAILSTAVRGDQPKTCVSKESAGWGYRRQARDPSPAGNAHDPMRM